MENKQKILSSRKKRIHEKRLSSDVVDISYLLKSEKKINYPIIDKWIKRIITKISAVGKQ
jgi:hypothetical protein